MKFAICDPMNGDYKIRSIFGGTTDQSVVDHQCTGDQKAFAVADQVNDLSYYVKASTGKANLRDTTPCTPSATSVPADGTTALTLSQMRDGTTLAIRGPVSSDLTSSGDNASYALTFTTPGDYTITATAPFPARPKTIHITAT